MISKDLACPGCTKAFAILGFPADSEVRNVVRVGSCKLRIPWGRMPRVAASPAKSGVSPALSRNGQAPPGDESGRLTRLSANTSPRKKGRSCETA